MRPGWNFLRWPDFHAPVFVALPFTGSDDQHGVEKAKNCMKIFLGFQNMSSSVTANGNPRISAVVQNFFKI